MDLVMECRMKNELLTYQPTVLVVDDDENIIAAFQDFFRREHYTMISASSSAEALQKIKGRTIDLLVTDIRLQYQSGVSLFLQLKAMYPDLSVIVITGYPDAIKEQEVVALGAKCLLLKPLDLNRLREAINS
jgi:DNA-binding NtrC family response regulator